MIMLFVLIIQPFNITIMKKIFLSTLFLALAMPVFCQNDLISNLFNKYNGQEGITIVNVTGDMLNIISQAEQERRDTVFQSRLDEVRILSTEGNCDQKAALDLRSEVYEKLDKSVYKEMISVKQDSEDVFILMKEKNGHVSEILIISQGKNSALVQVKGDILLSEMAELADKMPMKGMEQFQKMNQ